MRTDDLRHRLFPAVPVPRTPSGAVDPGAHESYEHYLAQQAVDGVAVWAHTGRGLSISREDRAWVLRRWRAAMPSPSFVIAGAGARANPGDGPADLLARASDMARLAADLGADAILVHPPTPFRGLPDAHSLIVRYHDAIAGAGLPLILFYLYEDAGGVSYDSSLLTELLSRDEVLGIKLATLDSVMTFQDVAALIAQKAPNKVLVTGEDRFLGYSALAGARSALIGMGAACPGLQARLLQAAWNADGNEFLRLNPLVDDLARHTFRAPMEGYIQRMLWCLAELGVIPDDSTRDPWGPSLDPSERRELSACLARIGELPERRP